MNFDWPFFWKSLLTPSAPFLDGLVLTVVISVVAMVLATVTGLVVALMRRSALAPLRWVAGVYIWSIRGTPLLVQLVLMQQVWLAQLVLPQLVQALLLVREQVLLQEH